MLGRQARSRAGRRAMGARVGAERAGNVGLFPALLGEFPRARRRPSRQLTGSRFV